MALLVIVTQRESLGFLSKSLLNNDGRDLISLVLNLNFCLCNACYAGLAVGERCQCPLLEKAVRRAGVAQCVRVSVRQLISYVWQLKSPSHMSRVSKHMIEMHKEDPQ
jgi:hypothetical protein